MDTVKRMTPKACPLGTIFPSMLTHNALPSLWITLSFISAFHSCPSLDIATSLCRLHNIRWHTVESYRHTLIHPAFVFTVLPPQKKLVIISKTTYSLIFKNKTFLHPIIKVSVSLTEYRCLCSCDWPNTLGNNLFLFSLYFPISSASSFVSLCLCMYACLPNTKLSGYVLSKVLAVSIIYSVLAGMSYPRPTGFIQND